MKTLKFKIEDTVYEIPTRWEDCTFGQYIDLLRYTELGAKSITRRIINTISVLAGDENLKRVLYEDADRESVFEMGKLIKWTDEEPDIKKFNKYKQDTIIDVDGHKYKLKANYNESITNWDMIHIEELKLNDKFNYHIWELIFGVLFRKVDENGNEAHLSPELIIDTIENFRNKVKMETIYSVLYFFLNGQKTSLKDVSKFSSGQKKIIIQILTDQEKSTKPKRKTKKKA